jgi:hypothetical protein
MVSVSEFLKKNKVDVAMAVGGVAIGALGVYFQERTELAWISELVGIAI